MADKNPKKQTDDELPPLDELLGDEELPPLEDLLSGTNPAEKKNEKPATELPVGGGSSGLRKTNPYEQGLLDRQGVAIEATSKKQPTTKEQPKPYSLSQVATERKKKVDLNPVLKGAAQSYKDYKAADENLRNAQMDLTAGLQGEKDVIQTDVLGKPVAIQGSLTEQKIKGLQDNVNAAKATKQAAKESLIKVSPAFKDKNIDIVSELQKDNTDVEETIIPQAVEKIKFVEDISDLEDTLKANGQTLDDWSKYVDTEAPKEFLDDKQRALYDVIKTGDEANIKAAQEAYYKDIDDEIKGIDSQITQISVSGMPIAGTGVGGQQQIADLKKQKEDLLNKKQGFLQPADALKQVAEIDPSFGAVDKLLGKISPMQRVKMTLDNLYAIKIKQQARLNAMTNDPQILLTQVLPFQNEISDLYADIRKTDEAIRVLAPIAFLNQTPDMEQSNWTRFGRGVWNTMTAGNSGIALPKKEDIADKTTSLMAASQTLDNISGAGKEAIKKTIPDLSDKAIDLASYMTAIGITYAPVGGIVGATRLPTMARIAFGNIGKYSPLLGRIAPSLTNMFVEGVESEATGRLLGGDAQQDLTFISKFGAQGVTEFLNKSPFGKLVNKAVSSLGIKEVPKFVTTLANINSAGTGSLIEEGVEEGISMYQSSDSYEDFKKQLKQFVGSPSDLFLFAASSYALGGFTSGLSPNVSNKFYQAADKAYNDLPPNEKTAFDNVVKDVNQGQEDAVMEVVLKTVDKVPNKVVDGLVTDLNTALDELGKTEVGEDGYEVKIGDTVYQGNTAQDLQNDIDDAQSLLAIYKGEQDHRTQNGITIEEETPTNTEQVQQQPVAEEGVGVEGAVVPENVGTANAKQEGTNKRGSTYKTETTEKDGIKVTKYVETNKDGKNITVGGRVMTPKEFIKDYNVTDQNDLDNLDGATEIVVQEVRTNKEGKQGITVRVSFGTEKMAMEVKGAEMPTQTQPSPINAAEQPETVQNAQENGQNVTEPTKAPAIKAQVVGTTAGLNTIIDGGLGKQKDPRTAFTSSERSPVFETQPNNNESSFLDISLPSYDSFGRNGGIQIRFELPNGVDANTVFEAVKKEAAKVGKLDAKDPNFKQTVQGLVDKGIAEIQGLATGGAKQTAQVKETVSEKQGGEPLKDVEAEKEAAPPTEQELDDYYEALEQEKKNVNRGVQKDLGLKGGETIPYKNAVIHAKIGSAVSPNDLGGSISKESFEKFGDPNYLIGNDKATKYLRKLLGVDEPLSKGINRKVTKKLDTLAAEISESNNIEVTPEDIVEYLLDRAKRPEAYQKAPNKKIKVAEAVADTNNKAADDIETLGRLGTFADDFNIDDPAIQGELAFLFDEGDLNNLKEYINHLNLPENAEQKRKVQKRLQGDRDVNNAITGGKQVESRTGQEETAPTQKVDEGQAKPIGESPQDVEIASVFNSNPELAKIGTQQQYSQYLDTIFPNSKVKDIVYHGSASKFDAFEKEKLGINTKSPSAYNGFFFAKDKETSLSYIGEQTFEYSQEYIDYVNQFRNELDRLNSEIDKTVTERDTILKKLNNLITKLLDFINGRKLSAKEKELAVKIENLYDEFKKTREKDANLQRSVTAFVKKFNKDVNDVVKTYIKQKENTYLYRTILNIENPNYHNDKNQGYRVDTYNNRTLEDKKKGYDGTIIQNTKDLGSYVVSGNYNLKNPVKTDTDVIVVYEPDQIHILGTKKDIDGFKEFVNKTNLGEKESKAKEQAIPNETIDNLIKGKGVYKALKSIPDTKVAEAARVISDKAKMAKIMDILNSDDPRLFELQEKLGFKKIC